MLRMASAQLPKGCANIAAKARMSRQCGRPPRDFGSVAAFPDLGEGKFVRPAQKPVIPGPAPH